VILKRLIALLLLSASFYGVAEARHYQDDAPPMGILTGPRTGTYIAFGRDIAHVAASKGVTIQVFESNGSIDNIKRITSKEKVGLAIVQSDVLGFLSRSKNPESVAAASKLRLVAPLYNEEVHILARGNIATLADLAGKRVVVGSAGSGSMITAVNIFSLLGITPAKMYEIDPPRGVVAVLNNEVDAVVFVGGKPVKIFKNMEELAKINTGANAGKLEQVHFLPLDDARLLKEYKPAALTHNDYSFITSDVPGIAVTALLVSYDYTMKDERYYHAQCRNMKKLAEALRDNLDTLKANSHPKWKEVDFGANIDNWTHDACSSGVFTAATSAPSDTNSLEKDILGVVRNKAQ